MCYDLERLIANYHDKLTIIDIKIILYQITKGLAFLHENKLIHRVLILIAFIKFISTLRTSNHPIC